LRIGFSRSEFLAVLAMVVLAAFAAGCGGSGESAAIGGEREKLRFAVTDLTGLEELQRDFEPFRDVLAEALGNEVELFPVSDRTAAAAALQSDQVDVVLTGPAEYAVMRARTEAVPLVGITRPGYRSFIVVPADSDIREVTDLKGRSIALSDVGSTSGYLGPAQIMYEAGLQPTEDVEMLALGDSWGQAFLNDRTDAYGGSALDWEKTLESSGRPASDFRVLAESEDFPPDVFIASKKLSEERRQEIRNAMLQNEQALVDAILQGKSGENDKYRGSKLVAVEDSDYDPIRDAYAAVGQDTSEFFED
jgi:phosphonate transport system substrate-binding protein